MWQGKVTETPLATLALTSPQPQRPARELTVPLFSYATVSLLFAIPYLLLADLGARMFFRNWLRCISGPTHSVLHSFDGPINALWPYAAILPILIAALVALLSLTPFRTLPKLAHITIAFLWCSCGFVSTMAI